MSMDVNNVANLVKAAQDLQGSGVETQKAKLQTLFTQAYFNEGQAARDTLDPEIKRLETKIKDLEKTLQELVDKVEANRYLIEDKAEKVSNLLMRIDSANEAFLKGQKQSIDDSVTAAFRDFEKGEIGRGEITARIQQYMTQHMPNVEINAIQSLFAQYATSNSQLKLQIDGAADIIEKNNIIRTQMGATKATLDLLKKTRDNMGTAAGAYKNIDTDASVPIYTPKKEALVDTYLDKYTARLSDTSDVLKTGVTPATQEQKDAMVNGFKAQYGVAATPGVDPYSINNAQVVSLGKALGGDNNIIKQMSDAGFTRKEIIDTVNKIFTNVGIAHQTDGSYTLPYGHGTEAANIYKQFADSMTKVTGAQPNPALTVGGNPQLKELGQALKDGILNDMKAAGFTFKETFYALQKIFPGVDFGFELGKTTLNLPEGDDQGAKDIYKELGGFVGKEYPEADVKTKPSGTGEDGANGNIPPPKRTDPVGFAIGNTTYEFMIDRDGDGKLDGMSEMMGANGIDGMEELAKYADANGIIKGDALKEIMMLRTNHDNRDYGFISAAEAGIKEIDLNTFLKKEDKKGDDFVNVNNALKTGEFQIKMNNGTTVDGYQKYETDAYINTVYKEAFGRNMFSDLSDKTVNTAITDAYADVDNKLSGVKDIISAIMQLEQGSDSADYQKRWNTFQSNKAEVEGYRNQRLAEATGLVQTNTAEQIKAERDAFEADLEAVKEEIRTDGLSKEEKQEPAKTETRTVQPQTIAADLKAAEPTPEVKVVLEEIEEQ